MKVFVAMVCTEAGDTYTYVYKEKPNKIALIEEVCKKEGNEDHLDWYLDVCHVLIRECEVR